MGNYYCDNYRKITFLILTVGPVTGFALNNPSQSVLVYSLPMHNIVLDIAD